MHIYADIVIIGYSDVFMKVKIERLDHLGNGIAFVDGKVTFVSKTIPGDEVEIKLIKKNKNYNKAEVINILKKSENRMQAFCPYYEKCGGCHLQNLSYEKTLEFKKDRVKNILNRVGINQDIKVIKNQSPLNYRNKIELKFNDGVLGFYEEKSNDIVNIKKCMITKECINNFFDVLNKMGIKNGKVTLRCNYNDELLVWIKTKDEIKLDENILPKYKVVGIVLNDETIYGENHFLDKVDNFYFEVSHDTFFQVNSYINSKLFEIIKEEVSGKCVLDLYSGVGTLAIMASKSAKEVFGIEINKNSVLNAIKNARINCAENINFLLGDVAEKVKYIKDKAQCVIVDPPRSGLDDGTINYLLDILPEKIVFISCETQKMSEDLKKLLPKYEVKKIYILDMFSYSYHVETLCVLEKIS